LSTQKLKTLNSQQEETTSSLPCERIGWEEKEVRILLEVGALPVWIRKNHQKPLKPPFCRQAIDKPRLREVVNLKGATKSSGLKALTLSLITTQGEST
jgi:hypothetical protein